MENRTLIERLNDISRQLQLGYEIEATKMLRDLKDEIETTESDRNER